MKYFLYIIIFCWFALPVKSQPPTPQEMVLQMKRGINLGNTLSAPYEGNWASPVKESYFISVSNAGFTNVRIPIRFDKHTTALDDVDYTDNQGNYNGSSSDYTVESEYLDRIEEVVGWALKYQLIPVIDVHGDKWFWESYDPDREEYKTGADLKAAEDRFKAIWMAISDRFKTYPPELLFEIMNEPYFSMDKEQVHRVNTMILQIIRMNNPSRIVIITGGGKNSWEAPLNIKPELIQSDSYLLATFHYYLPRDFTSSSEPEFNDFYWGTTADQIQVTAHFDAVKNWSLQNDIPVFLGEFGADNENGYNYSTGKYGQYGGPDPASRERYHRYLADAALERGFSFAAWDAGEKAGKTIYLASTDSWVEPIKNALLGINTAIREPETDKKKFKIFPNPASEKINFEASGNVISVRIRNFTNFDKEYKFDGTQHRVLLDVSGLNPGFYTGFVQVTGGHQAMVPFVKL